MTFCCSNSVNLTDGMDGLAAGTMLISAMACVVMSYFASHLVAAHHLGIPFGDRCGGNNRVCSCHRRGLPWAFCGLIVIRPRFLWAIPVLNLWWGAGNDGGVL